MQAFALQHILQRLGHTPITINRKIESFWLRRLASIGGDIFNIAIGRRKRIRQLLSEHDQAVIYQNTHRFINEHILVSKLITSSEKLRNYVSKSEFDALIVGSDQVWRKSYIPCMSDYFLGFLPCHSPLKKLAYAASFGLEKWQFSRRETKLYAKLAKRFTAISVRERSAVKLCQDYLGVEATQVLDPTMLVDKSVYENLAYSPYTHDCPGDLFYYILDNSPHKTRIIHEWQEREGLSPFGLIPTPYDQINLGSPIDDCILPPVEQWIRSFMDAKMVITDSFHGTIFSIIFQKPFILIPNAKRGNSRFEIFFKLCHLKKRQGKIVTYSSEYSDETRDNLITMKNQSINFLSHHL